MRWIPKFELVPLVVTRTETGLGLARGRQFSVVWLRWIVSFSVSRGKP